MKTKYSKHFFMYTTGLLVMSHSLSAESKIGSREISEEILQEIIAQDNIEETENIEKEIAFNDWQSSWNATNPRTHYQIDGVEPNQNLVRLTDCSEWKISPYDLQKMDTWSAGQEVIIEVDNNSWVNAVRSGQPYIYRLINIYNKSSVRAILSLGSDNTNPLYRHVDSLLKSGNQLSLNGPSKNDATFWRVSSSDSTLFQEWKMDDSVIIGYVKKAWLFSNKYDTILINANLNHYVRAEQI